MAPRDKVPNSQLPIGLIPQLVKHCTSTEFRSSLKVFFFFLGFLFGTGKLRK